jgi:hypothetical protein
LAPLARTGSLDLTILDGPLDALLELESEADIGARLPGGASSGGRLLETARCRVSCAVGSRALVRSLESQGFVSGVSVVDGSVCFVMPPSPNATLATAGSGLEVEVRLERALAGSGVRTRIRAEACRRTADRSASTVDLAERAPGSGAAGQRIGPAWLPYDIDLPRQERMRVSSSTLLLPRRPALLAIDDAGEGFGRAAVASLDVESWLDRPASAGPPPVLPIAGVDPPSYLTQRLHLPPPLLRQQHNYDGEWEPQEPERGELATLATPADIAAVVERFVGQGTWEPGSTVLRGASLLVLQPPAAHAVVASFLRSLAAREERRVFVELLLASPEAVRAVAPEALRPGASPWLPAEALRRIARAAPAGAILRAASGRAGELLLLPPLAVSSYLDDYEVSQIGAIPASQPVVHGHAEGSYAEAQALPGPGDTWCRLDLRWGCVRPEGAPLRRRAIYGDIDLPGRSHEEVRTTVAIPRDATAVLGVLEFPGEGGLGGQDPGPRSFVALARVRCSARDAAAADGDGPFLVDAGALLAEPPWGRGDRWRGPVISFAREGGPAPPALTVDELRGRLGGAMAGDVLERIDVQGRFVVGRGSAAEADQVRAALEGLARDRLRQVTLDICALPSTAELLAAAAPDGTLRDGPWSQAIESARSSHLRVTGVHGIQLRIAGVRGRSYLAGINGITGGSAAVLGHLYDPETEFAGGGAVLEATPDLTGGATGVDVSLRLELAPQPIFGRTVRTPTPVAFTPIPSGASTAAAHAVPPAPSPPAAAPDPTIELELPEDLGSRHRHRVRVPSAQPTLLGVEPDPAAPGKARALVLWARESPLP